MRRSGVHLFLWLLSLCLCGVVGCLPWNTDAPDVFVDESPLDDLAGGPLESGPGGFCRSSMDCSALRCVNHQGYQFCVEPCASDSDCDSGQCNPVEGDGGWCALQSRGLGTPHTEDGFAPEDVNTDQDPVTDPTPPLTPPSMPADDGCGDSMERAQWEALNADRLAYGLQALQCDDRLVQVARAHSEDMGQRRFFDHVNPDGEAPWDRLVRFGVTGWRQVGENIAYGYDSPASVQEGWMNSPGHRENILNPEYTHIGIGTAVDEQGQIFWTQLFASF